MMWKRGKVQRELEAGLASLSPQRRVVNFVSLKTLFELVWAHWWKSSLDAFDSRVQLAVEVVPAGELGSGRLRGRRGAWRGGLGFNGRGGSTGGYVQSGTSPVGAGRGFRARCGAILGRRGRSVVGR